MFKCRCPSTKVTFRTPAQTNPPRWAQQSRFPEGQTQTQIEGLIKGLFHRPAFPQSGAEAHDCGQTGEQMLTSGRKHTIRRSAFHLQTWLCWVGVPASTPVHGVPEASCSGERSPLLVNMVYPHSKNGPAWSATGSRPQLSCLFRRRVRKAGKGTVTVPVSRGLGQHPCPRQRPLPFRRTNMGEDKGEASRSRL